MSLSQSVRLDVPDRPSGQFRHLRRIARSCADLLLPPVCIVCRDRIEGHGLLCAGCWSRIDFIAPPLCDRLGIPLLYDAGTPSLSAAAIADPPAYDRARAVARYDGVMRDLIQNFKYRDRHDGVPMFGRWLAHAGAELLGDADLTCPFRSTRHGSGRGDSISRRFLHKEWRD